jgi:hypothetical protein
MPTPTTAAVQVTYVTASACHYCDHGRAVLAAIAVRVPLDVREVSLNSDEGRQLLAVHRFAFPPPVPASPGGGRLTGPVAPPAAAATGAGAAARRGLGQLARGRGGWGIAGAPAVVAAHPALLDDRSVGGHPTLIWPCMPAW